MRYKVRYEFEGTRGRMNYLRPGDVIEIIDRDKPIETKILWTVERQDGIIYGTDNQGIIYARELERIR